MPNTTDRSAQCVVLIIEDDPDDVFLLQKALKNAAIALKCGVEVVVQRNGIDGIYSVARDDMQTKLPDVIVVDLNMPLLNGEEFLKLLRDLLQLRKLPAVVLTTSAEKPIHDGALAAGADRVFVKPDTLAELELVARTILDIGVGVTPAQAVN